MAKDLYLLDFDRTVFDSKRFFQDRIEALNNLHGVDLLDFDKTYDAHIDPQAGGYNAHSHMQELTDMTPDEYDAAVERDLAGRDYCYEDVVAWLAKQTETDNDIIIITLGWPRYQQLKFNHCKPIAGLRKIVMPTNKGRFIRDYLQTGEGEYDFSFLKDPYDHIYLIDDAISTFTALGATDKITGIRIVRPGEKGADVPTPPGIREIKSFGEL